MYLSEDPDEFILFEVSEDIFVKLAFWTVLFKMILQQFLKSMVIVEYSCEFHDTMNSDYLLIYVKHIYLLCNMLHNKGRVVRSLKFLL
jgi:hypothetical protein